MKRISTSRDKREFCPTVEEDIENDELKNLAERLKGDSEKETLTNILEWQDRNIHFWWERWPLGNLLLVLLLISLMITIPLLPLFPSIFRLLIAGIAGILIVIVVMILLAFAKFHKYCYIVVFSPFVYPLGWIFHIPLLAQNILPCTLIYVGCLGAIVLIMVYLCIRYKIFSREKSLKEIFKSVKEFFKVIYDLSYPSLPVDKIIKFEKEKYGLAICRDYAKLTASLLFKIYPDSKVYFITIPNHVAAGIEIKNKCYVLDQHPPILTINDWLIKQKKKADNIYISKLERDSEGRPINVTFDKDEIISKEPKEVPKINTEKLTEEIAEIFGIEPSSHINKPDLKFKIPPINYEDDEITKYSLIRAIKNRLEREFCGNTDKMSKININQDKISVKIKET